LSIRTELRQRHIQFEVIGKCGAGNVLPVDICFLGRFPFLIVARFERVLIADHCYVAEGGFERGGHGWGIRHHRRTCRPLGGLTFLDRLKHLVGRILRPLKRGPKPKQGELRWLSLKFGTRTTRPWRPSRTRGQRRQASRLLHATPLALVGHRNSKGMRFFSNPHEVHWRIRLAGVGIERIDLAAHLPRGAEVDRVGAFRVQRSHLLVQLAPVN